MMRVTSAMTDHSVGELGGLTSLRATSCESFVCNVYRGHSKKVVDLAIPTKPSFTSIVSCFRGAAFVGTDSDSPQMMTAGCVAAVQRGRDVNLSFGRGLQTWLVYSWDERDLKPVSGLIESQHWKDGLGAAFVDETTPACKAVFDMLRVADDEPSTLLDPALTAVAALCTEAIEHGPPSHILAPVPPLAPDLLKGLLESVREDPSKSWSLKDAADLVGYSAFHLSRVFRAHAPYGFPVFVDRCRAERALEMLTTTEATYHDVSLQCGFGSTQAMRNACRDYYGLLPSEIRSLGS